MRRLNMRSTTVVMAIVFALFFSGLPGGLPASDAAAQSSVTLVSNTGKPVVTWISALHAGDTVIGTWGSDSYTSRAVSFTTGDSSAGYVLESITMIMSFAVDPEPRVSVYSDDSGKPGTVVHSLATPSGLVNDNEVRPTFTAAANRTLDPSKKYWVVVDSTSTANIFLHETNSTGEDAGGQANWSIGNNQYSSQDSGVTWANQTSNESYSVKLTGKVVPVPDVKVSETSLSVAERNDPNTTDNDATATYTVVLGSQPSSDVMVSVTSGDTNRLTVSTSSLTFSTGNWNTTQDVTVTGRSDGDLAANDVTVTHAATSSDSDYNGFTVDSVSVTVTDSDVPRVLVSTTTLGIDEGSTGTYTVKLNKKPSSTVTVKVSVTTSDGVTVSAGSDTEVTSLDLLFTTTSWNQAQTVTVNTAAADADILSGSATIGHFASGAEYGDADTSTTDDNVYGDEVAVTARDLDGDVLDLDNESNVQSLDEGSSGTYTVKLSTTPKGNVSVAISSSEAGVLAFTTATQSTAAATATLMFTTVNWSSPQDVTVVAVSDDDSSDESVMIKHTVTDYGASTGPTISVAVDDDDEQDVELSGTTHVMATDEHSLSVTEEQSTTYGVRLKSGPHPDTETVTIRVEAPVDSDLKLKKAGGTGAKTLDLEFTGGSSGNWDEVQMVTVEAGADDDTSDDDVTLTHSASGADYAGLTIPSIDVTISDDDTADLAISKSSLPIEETDGPSEASFTVKLAFQPSSDVDVGLSFPPGSDSDIKMKDGTSLVSSKSLRFTPTDWNTAVTVVVNAAADDDAVDGSATLNLVATQSGGNMEYAGKSGSVSVSVNDDETLKVDISPSSITVVEDATFDYTITLTASPSSSVNVYPVIAMDDQSTISVNREFVVLTSSNWSTGEMVTVTGEEDEDGEDGSVTVTHEARGLGPLALPAEFSSDEDALPSLMVTVTDNDPKGIEFEAADFTTAATQTIEMGENTTTQYRLRLKTKPTEEVTVRPIYPVHQGLQPIPNTLLSINMGSGGLMFDADNWNVFQAMPVEAQDDADAQNNKVYVNHTWVGYGFVEESEKPDDLIFNIVDDDEAGVTVDADDADIDGDGNFVVTEGDAGGNTFTVGLTSQPVSTTGGNQNGTVKVSVTDGLTVRDDDTDSAQGTAFFTVWTRTVTFTITANDDDDAVDETGTISFAVSGGDYDNVMEPSDITVKIVDDDEADLELSATSINVTEQMVGEDYTIKPTSEPSGQFTVNISSDNPVVNVVPTSLTFDGTDWATAKAVTVTAIGDDDAFDDTATITHTTVMTDGAHLEYHNLQSLGTVSATVNDDDEQGVKAVPPTLIINEPLIDTDTSTGNYVISLATLPVDADGEPSSVTVTINDPSNTDITVDEANVTLGSSNWSSGVQVTVRVAADDDTQADSGTITHTASGADYDSATEDTVSVSVTDTDTPNVLPDPSNVTVTEGASDDSYTVRLSTEPASEVTVTPSVAIGGSPDVTFSPATLRFTDETWDVEQTVTVTAAEDADAAADTATITHTSSGADYGGLTITSVNVTVTENDTLQIDVSPPTLTILEGDLGAFDTYQVTLHAAPADESVMDPSVTIEISVIGDDNVATVPRSLTFNASEWVTATTPTVSKTVVVNVSNDLDGFGPETSTIRHQITGSSDYATTGVTAGNVMVAVNDPDARGVNITPRSLNIREGQEDIYHVRLFTRPTGLVTVTINDPTDSDAFQVRTREGTKTLEFGPDNWNVDQDVIVVAVIDADAIDDVGTITHSVAGADYTQDPPIDPGDVTVSSTDIVSSTDEEDRGVEIDTTADPYLMSEGGEPISYRVRLETEPSGTVTITPVSDNSDISFDPSSLSFTVDDWDEFQTIQVTAGQDADAAPDIATITHEVTGADYGTDATLDVANVNLEIADDDQANVVVSVTTLDLDEGSSSGYTIVLGSGPVDGDVTITLGLTSDTDSDITIDQMSLTFTAENWSDAQLVTVAAAHDLDLRDDTGTITHEVTGANFTGATIEDIAVTVSDDDTAAINIDQPMLTIDEGNSATYTVGLGIEPSGNVTIRAISDNSDVTLSPSVLTFTPENWNTPQVVIASASVDTDATNDNAEVSHTASGSEYEGVVGATVSVLVVEDGTSVPDDSSFLQSSSCDGESYLTWNAPTAGSGTITSFRIQWRLGDEQYSTSRSVTAVSDATSYTLATLTNGLTYTIRVRGLDSTGEPVWSRETTSTPGSQPCINAVRFGNILADSTLVIVEVEDPEPGTTVNMRYRSLNPGVWSDVESKQIAEGEESVTFDIRGLEPENEYEVQAWLGAPTPPEENLVAPMAVAQTIFSTTSLPDEGEMTGDGGEMTGDGGEMTGDGGEMTGDGGEMTGDGGEMTGDGGEMTGDGGGSVGGGGSVARILRIEPSIRAVTVSPGDQFALSVEVWGRQGLPDNGLADKDPADSRPEFVWSSDGSGTFNEGRVRSEWRDDEANDREVTFVAPSVSGTMTVTASLLDSAECLAQQDDETSADHEARCTARIEITVVRGSVIQPDVTAPVNPHGEIPETLTDTEGVAYAVFTPVDGGSFVGDGYLLSAGSGAVANGEYIGISMTPVGDASNVGKTWHRYTLGGRVYSVDVVDSTGATIADYALGEAASVCVPMPAELRANIADIVLTAMTDDGGMTVLSTRVTITPDGVIVCGNLSSLPADVAVGKVGSPPEIEESEIESSDEPLPDAGGAAPMLPLVVMLLMFGSLAVIVYSLAAMRLRRRR